MASIAVNRLMEERKQWRKEKNSPHFEGFEAGPMKSEDGSSNWMVWHCYIPGKQATVWEGAKFKLRFEFPEDYPAMPPKCKFEPVIFHPNIYPSPNNNDPAQSEPSVMLRTNPVEYRQRLILQTKLFLAKPKS